MAVNEELISDYIDLPAVTQQTDAFLGQIKRLNDAYDALAQKGVNLGGLSSSKEITGQIKILQEELGRLQKAKKDMLDVDLKAAKVATETQRSLALQAKASKENAAALLSEAKAANEAEKAKTRAANVKANSNSDVPFTTNLDALEKERQAALATGTVVNDLEKAHVADSLAAIEWANAQNKATVAAKEKGKAVKLSADEIARNQRIEIEDKLIAAEQQVILKRQVIEQNNVKGSLDQRRAALARLNAEYDKLGPQQRASAAGQRLQTIIGGLTGQVKSLEESTGRAQRNVGNYAAGFEKSATNFNKFGEALGKGFGVIRQIAYIPPGVGIAGIIGGATDAIISFATAESKASIEATELKKQQDELNKSLNEATGSAKSQGEQVTILARAVQDGNLPYAQRQRALDELKKINKAYFGDLTLEGDLYGGLQKKVQDYTTALILANVQKARGENLTKANIDLADTRRELQNLDEQISKRQELIKINFESLKSTGLNNLAGVQSVNQLIANDSKILALGAKRLALYDKLGAATDEAGKRAIEYEDATIAALALPSLDDKQEEKDKKVKKSTEKKDKALQDYLKSLAEYLNLRRELEASEGKELQDIGVRNFVENLKRLQDARDKQIDELNKGKDESLDILNKRFQAGLISQEQYQKDRAEIEFNSAREILEVQIEFTEQYLKLERIRGKDTTKQESDLAKLKLDYSDLVTKHIIDNNNKEAKSTRDNLKETVKALEKISEITNKVFSVLGGAINASIVAQKNKLQDQSDGIDENSKKEIEAINNSTASEQDKAAKIAIVNARAQAQKDQIAKQQRRLDEQKARFDKAANIANIITSTALAVAKALPNIPLAVLAGALGAAELAVAIATPIPKYKYGTKNHPGGGAIVGDGGRPEFVLLPSGEGFTTPDRDTFMNLPRGSQVFPDANNLPEHLMRLAMKPQRTAQGAADGNAALIGMMAREIKGLKVAVLGKQENHFHWDNGQLRKSVNNSGAWTKYINDSI